MQHINRLKLVVNVEKGDFEKRKTNECSSELCKSISGMLELISRFQTKEECFTENAHRNCCFEQDIEQVRYNVDFCWKSFKPMYKMDV
jgi:hypothetical protein